jgi:hypothetical protein
MPNAEPDRREVLTSASLANRVGERNGGFRRRGIAVAVLLAACPAGEPAVVRAGAAERPSVPNCGPADFMPTPEEAIGFHFMSSCCWGLPAGAAEPRRPPTRSTQMKATLGTMLLAAALVGDPGVRAAERPPARPSGKVRILTVGNSGSIWCGWHHLLAEMLVEGGYAESVDIVATVSAGKSLTWHAKDGTALKWIKGEPPRSLKGAEESVAKARDRVAAEPNSHGAKCALREAESVLAQLHKPGWDYVLMILMAEDYDSSDEQLARVVEGFTKPALERGAKPIVWMGRGGTANVKRYIPLAQSLKFQLAPVTFARYLAGIYRDEGTPKNQIPERTSMGNPAGHPNGPNCYVFACTLYGVITGKSPEGLKSPVDPEGRARFAADNEGALTDEQALEFQRAAWQALREYQKLEATSSIEIRQ